MSESPQELRDRAAALERAAIEAEYRKGFWCGYMFDKAGRCFEEWLITVPCPNHTEPYHDEFNYGLNFCTNCRNREGTIKVTRRIAAPEYDAPRPPGRKPR